MHLYRLSSVKKARTCTLAILQELDQEGFDFRPASEKWSAGEVADHLIKANRMYLTEIRKLIALKRAGKIPRISVGLTEMNIAVPLVPRVLLPLAELPVGMFNYFFPNRFRELLLSTPIVPAEAPPILRPEGGRDRELLLSELSEDLETTQRLFSDNSDLDFSEMQYYHPLFGFNTLNDILGLLASHEERHLKQLQGIVDAWERHPG